jgi:hypothetical protein
MKCKKQLDKPYINLINLENIPFPKIKWILFYSLKANFIILRKSFKT